MIGNAVNEKRKDVAHHDELIFWFGWRFQKGGDPITEKIIITSVAVVVIVIVVIRGRRAALLLALLVFFWNIRHEQTANAATTPPC